MQARGIFELAALDDGALEASLRGVLAAERRTEASIVAHLAEMDARRGHLKAGKSSLFTYCVESLELSEAEAFNRITAARLSRQYPSLLELLASGRLHLSAICAARFYLTPDNHEQLLAAICGKSKRSIEELLAARYPSVRAEERSRKPSRMKALARDSFLLELVVDRKLKTDLELARDLLRHISPQADWAWVVQRSVDALLGKLRAQRFGARATDSSSQSTDSQSTDSQSTDSQSTDSQSTDSQSTDSQSTDSQSTDSQSTDSQSTDSQSTDSQSLGLKAHKASSVSIGDGSRLVSMDHDGAKECCSKLRKRRQPPRRVRREVVARDGLGCCYVGPDGARCGSRAFLEFHHMHAWARGGDESLENLQLLCRAHNRLVAEQELSATYISARIAQRQER